MAKRKQKVKIIYRNKVPKVPPFDESKKVKEEINELESKKAQAGTGVRGFLKRAAINRQIYDKRAFISAKDKLRATKQQTELGKALLEKEKVKAEFAQVRKKSQVNFDDLYK